MRWLNGFVGKEKQHECVPAVELREMSDTLRRIENRQKEAALLLEDIDSALQEDDSRLIHALIGILDMIHGFVAFAGKSKDDALLTQARMMYDSGRRAAHDAGLEVICAEGVSFDHRLHAIAATDHHQDLPNGYVIQTIRPGYLHNDKILRLADVAVNKTEGEA